MKRDAATNGVADPLGTKDNYFDIGVEVTIIMD